MATIPLVYPDIAPGQAPQAYSDFKSFSVFAGNSVADSALVVKDGTNAGYVKESTGAGTTPYNTAGATIVGLAMHNSASVFAPQAGATKFNTPFGVFTQTGTALVPNDPLQLRVALFHNGNRFVFSLDPAIALTQSLVGSTIGLATTGTGAGDIWYATTTGTGSCLCATVVSILQGPGLGVIGTDSGGRLELEFSPTFLLL